MAALTSSDFTPTNNGGGSITWTGGKLDTSRPSAGNSWWEVGNTTKNSGIIILQANITWSLTPGANPDMGGMKLTSAGSFTNDAVYSSIPNAAISSRTTNGGNEMNLAAGSASWSSYRLASGVTKSKDFKITYDYTGHDIKFWYWNGSSWTQMGTTQNYNLGAAIKVVLWCDNFTADSLGTLTFDKIYFDTYASDYVTQYPASGAVTSGNFFQFFN